MEFIFSSMARNIVKSKIYLQVKRIKKSEEFTDTESLLPVLVYIHVGGVRGGSSRYDCLTADTLMLHKIVFVTVNYRVGPFGKFNDLSFRGEKSIPNEVMRLFFNLNRILEHAR